MKKIMALLLALTLVASMAACGNSNSTATTAAPATEASTEAPAETEAPAADVEAAPELTGDYDTDSTALYNYVLGDFYEKYAAASEMNDASEAWANMAIAEAKLLEAGVMLPVSTQGGRFAISRVVPHTAVTPVSYGNDYERFHYAIVTNEFITAADREVIDENYAQLKGTGTYREWVTDYLLNQGYTLSDEYDIGYTSDPKTWDYFNTSRAADSEAITYSVEMLMYYDGEGVQQPGLAESYTVSDDGLTYTFKLREGLIWTDSQGRKVADVTADDFVAGFQHMMDAQGGLEFLIDGKVVGAHEYIAGETYDMSTVGVKALDDYTVEYTLESPCRYFLTMLGYNPFAPMSRSYYESQGGKFGEDYDNSAADYTYGTSPDTIAYCGPYLITNATAENTIVYQLNENYWNAENVTAKSLVMRYNDGTDVTKGYNDAKDDVIDGVNLVTATVELAKADGLFDDYAYVSDTNSTSYMSFWNINRAVFANVADDTTCVSGKTDDQKAVTAAAMLNHNFRVALNLSWDRATYNGQKVGEDVKLITEQEGYVLKFRAVELWERLRQWMGK